MGYKLADICCTVEGVTPNCSPATAIGHMLSQDEAAKLIKRMERGMPKRPAAPLVERRPAASARKRA